MKRDQMGHFFGELDLTFIDGTNWKVLQNPDAVFGYELKDGRKIIPDDHRTTDFASIPWFFRRILPKVGSKHFPYGRAVVLHDHLYDTQKINGVNISRAVADAVLLEAMLVDHVPEYAAYAMYYSVRWFGGGHWEEDK